MHFNKFRQYFSAPRVGRYMQACGNSKVRAKKLYEANLKIIQAFHPMIGVLEVVLRNRLNDILAAYFTDPDWIINQKAGFMVASSLTYVHRRTGTTRHNRYLKSEVERAEKRMRKAGVTITSGKVISEQTLGFWTDLFEVHHYKILKGRPIKIFAGLPPGYGRKEVCDELNIIRIFRNRINHNEPVCFNGNTIDFTKAQEVHQSVLNILSWIDPELVTYISSFDKVNRVINSAQRI